MPASLFADWVGQRGAPPTGRVTAVTRVTNRANACNSAAPNGVAEVTDAAQAAVTRVVDPQPPSGLVTEVTLPDSGGLPDNPLLLQRYNPNNPGNPGLEEETLDPSDPVAWRQLFKRRVIHRRLSGWRTRPEAEVLAYGDCLLRWHQLNRVTRNPRQCAACGKPFSASDAFDIDDAVRVHFDKQFDCIRRYGFARRSEAAAALSALGLELPEGFEL